ncbi:hypothetical protein STIAU_1586, partial [Stigmatella aurantiaca DW4/3-1]
MWRCAKHTQSLLRGGTGEAIHRNSLFDKAESGRGLRRLLCCPKQVLRLLLVRIAQQLLPPIFHELPLPILQPRHPGLPLFSSLDRQPLPPFAHGPGRIAITAHGFLKPGHREVGLRTGDEPRHRLVPLQGARQQALPLEAGPLQRQQPRPLGRVHDKGSRPPQHLAGPAGQPRLEELAGQRECQPHVLRIARHEPLQTLDRLQALPLRPKQLRAEHLVLELVRNPLFEFVAEPLRLSQFATPQAQAHLVHPEALRARHRGEVLAGPGKPGQRPLHGSRLSHQRRGQLPGQRSLLRGERLEFLYRPHLPQGLVAQRLRIPGFPGQAILQEGLLAMAQHQQRPGGHPVCARVHGLQIKGAVDEGERLARPRVPRLRVCRPDEPIEQVIRGVPADEAQPAGPHLLERRPGCDERRQLRLRRRERVSTGHERPETQEAKPHGPRHRPSGRRVLTGTLAQQHVHVDALGPDQPVERHIGQEDGGMDGVIVLARGTGGRRPHHGWPRHRRPSGRGCPGSAAARGRSRCCR